MPKLPASVANAPTPTKPAAKKETKAAAKADKKAAKPPAPAESKRPILYSALSAVIHANETHINVELAKKLLGWQEEGDGVQFGTKFAFKVNGRKIRCTNNETNRPLYWSNVDSLKQEILCGRWRFNGEPIIIGSTGLLLNGQHTLLALIIAAEEWEKNQDQWTSWDFEPAIDKLVVYGVAEDDETVNSMDTCKPRSLADVIFRAAYFKAMPAAAQRTLADMAKFAINKMWEQCGQYANAHAPKRNHSELIAFLDDHPKLLACIKHIYEEDNNENKINKFIPKGTAAAAMYLMGSSSSSSDIYYTDEKPREELLDWTMYDKASNFFVELASGKMKAVTEALANLIDDGALNIKARWAIIVKAWNVYKDGKNVTSKFLQLEFVVKDDARRLVEFPLIGGIDVGVEGLPGVDPTTTEVEAGMEAVQEKVTGKKIHKASRKGDTWKKGDLAWIISPEEDTSFVELTSDPYNCPSDGLRRVMVVDEGCSWEVEEQYLSLAQFEMKS